jgi:hypothetical protein
MRNAIIIVGGVVAAAALAVVTGLPELRRYLKIRGM